MPVFIIAVATIIIRMKMFSSSVFEGMKKAEFTYQETTFWNQDFLPWRPQFTMQEPHCRTVNLGSRVPNPWLVSWEYRVLESTQDISALLLMLVCTSNKRRNWNTESLMEDQSVCPHPHPCLRWCLHAKTLTDPSRSPWSLLSPEPVAPFIFVNNASSLLLSLQWGSAAQTQTQYTSS